MSFDEPEPGAESEPTPAASDAGAVTEQHTANRLLLLLGLAYLMLAALASGLAWNTFFGRRAGETSPDRAGEPEPSDASPDRAGEPELSPAVTPPSLPPRPPEKEPNAPGLHTRPDGSRYLIVPLPQPCHGPRPRASLPMGGTA